MSIPKLTNDLKIIQKLSDLPNSTDGLTAEQLKAKFDTAGLEIQRWANETLVPAITAENIPFPKSLEVDAETVEAAILAVQRKITDAASGAIIDGTVTKEKLAAALLERVYGGRCWVSLDTPDSADSPSSDFPIGQIWLRPAFSLKNKNTGNWQTSGCSASVSGNDVILTGTQTTTVANMAQSIPGAAVAGDRIYVLFDTGSIDSEMTEFTVSINGNEEQNARNGGVFSASATGSIVSVDFRAAWPSTSLANGNAEIRNLSVVNVDEILRAASGAKDMGNWGAFLKSQMPIAENYLPDALYIQKDSGDWWQLGFSTLPVSRGGTGVTEIGDGEMLYGRSGGFAKLEKPADDVMLQFSGGSPVWAAISTLANHGYARITTGSYVGNAEARTITLPVAPKLLVIHPDAAVLQDGVSQTQTLYGTIFDDGGGMISESYTAGIRLSGNKLTTYKTGGENLIDAAPKAWNQNGTTYNWVAIY